MLVLPFGWVGSGDAAPNRSLVGVTVIAAARTRTTAVDGNGNGSGNTEIRTLTIGAGDPRSTTLATLTHPATAIVRGDVLQKGGRFAGVAIVADERPRSAAYGSALSFVDPSGAVRRLATDVALGSRPLVGDDGLVYVQRGSASPAPTGDTTRIDALEIDAVDPSSGSIRVVMTWQGYITHLAGALGPDLVVYRVGPAGADLALVDRGTGKTRSITPITPFARDFSIDPTRNAVVLSNRDASDTNRWVVERYDLGTGARTELASTRDDATTPFTMPDGSVWRTAPHRGGLVSDRAPARVLAPLGAGYTYVTHASADGAWLALWNVPNEKAFDAAALYRPQTDRVVPLGSKSERVEVLGILGAQMSSLR